MTAAWERAYEKEQQEIAEREAERKRLREEAEARVSARTRAAKTDAEIEREAQIDEELEPIRVKAKKKFLLDHPDKTGADFSKYWKSRGRAAALEQLHADRLEEEKARLRATGAYSA